MSINTDLVCQAATSIGQNGYPGPKLKKWAEDAGFVNIKEHVFKVPHGTWPKDPRLVSLNSKLFRDLTDRYVCRKKSVPGTNSKHWKE